MKSGPDVIQQYAMTLSFLPVYSLCEILERFSSAF